MARKTTAKAKTVPKKPPSKTAPKKAAPKRAAPKQAAPKTAAAKKAPRTAAKAKTTAKPAPKKTAAKQAVPEKASSAKAAPVKAAPKKTTVKKSVPKTTAGKKTTAKKTPATKAPSRAKASAGSAKHRVRSEVKTTAAKKPSVTKTATKKPAATKTTRGATKAKAQTKAQATTGNAPAGPTPLSDPGPAEVLGRITWLMLQSEAHKHMFLTDLEWRVLPPVLLKQFRLFRNDGNPIGYAAWAFLDEETDARLRKGEVKLKPDQWRSGPHLWLLDLVAPFGGQEAMLKEIAAKVFKDVKFSASIPAMDF